MVFPTTLPSLRDREAIPDALYRCVLGIDTDDKTLFDSAFTQDASFDFNGSVMSGLDAIHTGMFDNVSKLDTTHFVSNVRVNFRDGVSTASMTASALAQHFRPGQGNEAGATRLTSGSLYFIDLVKDNEDGAWRVKHWTMKLVWTEGDWGVMQGK